MTMKRKLWFSVSAIIILTVLGLIVDYPKGPNITWQGNLVRELKVQLGLDLQGGTSLTYQADVSQIPSDQVRDAMDSVRNVLENRINAFGVAEPVIQTNQANGNWRVLVELPGISDVNAAIQQIGETPLLEFKMEGESQPLSDDQLSMIRQLNEQNRTKAQETLDKIIGGADFTTTAQTDSQDSATASIGGDLGYLTKDNINAVYAEDVFASEPDRLLTKLYDTTSGYEIVKVLDKKDDTAHIAHIVLNKIPETPDIFGPTYVNTELTGKQLKHAAVQFDSTTNEPIVALTFNEEGSKLFEQLTKDNLNKTIAIYLDGQPISTPVVNDVITGGQAIISGTFALDEAKKLSQRLNAGALPVKINLINQRNVGPTLGIEALQRSVLAGVIAMMVLAIFMIIYYRWPGFIAMVALSIYGILLLAVFKLWPITLSLSGIAGFILSLGMAVDANVLIFERVKEELRNGKTLQSAIDDGFKRAWLSIRDSNVSSLITCFILSWFGTAMIKGFAVTLALGIGLSLFSAITITRTLLKILPVKHRRWYGI